MKLANVLKNSLFYTLATTLQGMISFFLLPIYTRYLSPGDYAVLALVTSFSGIVSAVMTLQIHTGIPRFVIKFLKDKERAKTYFSSIFLLLLLILFFGCLIINIFGERIIRILFSDKNGITYSPFFLIATWILLPNLLMSGGMTLLQTLENGYKFFLVTLVQVIINVSLSLFFVVFLRTGPIGVLWAQLISAMCGLIIVIWFIRNWLRFMFPRLSQDVKDSFRYSLPIIPHILSIYVYMYSDRLILQRFVPLSDIGIYSIADTFAYILLIVVNATTTAYSPRFLKLAEDNKLRAQGEIKNFMEIWWAGIMVIFMGYLLWSGFVVRLMTLPSFYPSIPLIPILAFAYIFRGLYCFSTNGLFFAEKTKYIPVITTVAAITNLSLNLIFIPKFGIFAAAWTTVISYFITFIVSYYFSRKFFPIFYPWKSMVKITMLLLSGYITVIFLDELFSHNMLLSLFFRSLISLIFITGIFLIMPRGYIRGVKKIFWSFKNKTQIMNFIPE